MPPFDSRILVMISHPSDERWIKTVPSEIMWLTFSGFVNDAQCRHVPLTRGFAIRLSGGYY